MAIALSQVVLHLARLRSEPYLPSAIKYPMPGKSSVQDPQQTAPMKSKIASMELSVIASISTLAQRTTADQMKIESGSFL